MQEPRTHKRRRRRRKSSSSSSIRISPRSYSRRSFSRRLRRLLRKKRVAAFVAVSAMALVGLAMAAIYASLYSPGSQSYETAHVRFTNGDFRGAVVTLQSVLQADSTNLPAQVLLGRSYLHIGYAKEAETALRRSFAAGADLALLAEPLAHAYLQQGKHETLLGTLRTDVADTGLRARIHALRGDAHIQVRDLNAAEAAYTMALDEEFNFVPALLGQVRVHIYRGQFKQAGKLTAFALEVGTHRAEALFVSGELARAQQQLAPAIAAYSEAIAVAPAHIPALLARAAIRVEQGEDEAANRDLQAVRAVRPSDPQADYLNALLWLEPAKKIRHSRRWSVPALA
ncbi:MAG: tetratricopeptide repeat protein [Gammaproteobacteria bacterium]|nr:tetratricopeptide repeat protein [Gammaproteobacteria bacterium]